MSIILLPLTLGAQGLKGSYFLDNSLEKTKLNPAFGPRANYFKLPVLGGGLGLGVYGNVGASNFLYPMDGNLYLFLNNNVPADQFVNSLPAMPGIDLSYAIDIVGFGFYTPRNSFWSFETGLTVDASIGLPKEFLDFAKRGPQDGRVYSLKGFNIYANASLYASLGYSRDIKAVKGLRIGAKARVLIPAAEASVDLGNSTITADSDKLQVNTDATGTIASTFFRLNPPAEDGEAPNFELLNNYAPAGYGFSVDLGAEYRLSVGSVMDGLTFSFAALNLGAKYYKASNVQKLASKGEVFYTGIEDISLDENSDFEAAFTKLGEDFVKLANFTDVSDEKNVTVLTLPTFHFGVEYPFARDKMSLGLLYTLNQRMNRTLNNELTVSYNLNPCRCFNLGVNYSFLNTYKSVGFILEISPKKGMDFFIGTDFLYTEMMPKIYLPVDRLWTNFRFGSSFMIGSKHRK